jgi:hypothetical protein
MRLAGDLQGAQGKAKFRDPDKLTGAARELQSLVPDYQKIAGARAIAPHMTLDGNRSHSFRVFVQGVRNLIQEETNGTAEA